MELGILEEAAWRTAPGAKPSEVARAVDALRDYYLRGEPAPARRSLLAKLLFYGVADAAKLAAVLGELAAGGALPAGQRWRVLDLGAGPGVTSVALAEWLRGRGLRPELEIVAVDRDDAALAAGARLHTAYAEVAGPEAPTIRCRAVPRDVARAPLPPGPFDLVLCANLLCEIALGDPDPSEARAALLHRVLAQALAPAGSLCVIEPALRDPARLLHRVRDRLLGLGATVYAPCLRGAPCPMLENERDWCHEDRPVELPERTRLVARLVGLRRHTLKYSYLTLRRDGRTLGAAFPDARFRVVSELLVSKGREEVFLCGEPGRLRVLRNRRDRSETNAAFGGLDRGQLVRIGEGTRVGPADELAAWDPGAE